MWTAIRNKLRNNLIIGLIGVALAAPASAAVLQPFKATYKAHHGFIGLGQATFQLQRSGSCWRWHGVANPSGLAALFIGQVTDTSQFCVARDGTLLPKYFRHHEEGDAESSYTLAFNWAKGMVQYNDTKPFEVPRGAIDPFLIQLAARLWLARAENPVNLSPQQFTIVDEQEIKTYRLAVSDGKRIETGAGTFNTLRVARVDEDDEQLIFWVAPKLDYLPVKVEHRANGDTRIALVLQSLKVQSDQGGTTDAAQAPDSASE